MVTKENLKDYAMKLMLDMDDAGYERTLKEFEMVEKHMALIGKIEGISDVEPQTFPYITYKAHMRKDDNVSMLDTEDVLRNSKQTKFDQVKVPKVVGE